MASNLRVDSIVPSSSGNVSIGTATGGVTIPGDLGIAGVLTYEDVTNIDSVGVITARDGLRVTGIATISGAVSIGDSIVHTGDTNTSIRFPAADTFAVETSGVERLRIGSAGQLGIGGANYGLDGQVLTSKGPSAAIQWATVSTTPFGGALDGLNFGGTETTYTSGGTTYKVHSFTSSGFLE